jgi:Holliday junction resolvase RusA-like endonuclease
VYDPKESRAWKQEIQRQIKEQWSGGLLSGPLSLYVNFYLPRPKSNKSAEHLTRPDISNMLKGFEDAIQGLIIENDSHIVFIAATKHYCNEKHPKPCIVGTIMEANEPG